MKKHNKALKVINRGVEIYMKSENKEPEKLAKLYFRRAKAYEAKKDA